jgi:hypothetical protein
LHTKTIGKVWNQDAAVGWARLLALKNSGFKELVLPKGKSFYPESKPVHLSYLHELSILAQHPTY